MPTDSPLESAIEAKLGRYAKSKNCLYKKFTSPSNRSVPDRIICTPHGVVGFLELKRKGCKPTEQQRHELRQLIERGHNASWVDSFEDGRQFIDDLLRGRPGAVFLQGAACRNMDDLCKGRMEECEGQFVEPVSMMDPAFVDVVGRALREQGDFDDVMGLDPGDRFGAFRND